MPEQVSGMQSPVEERARLDSSFVNAAYADLLAAGLVVDRELVLRFLASLATKRFVILTGLAGSGKTKLAQAIAAWLTPPVMSSDGWFRVGEELPADRVAYHVDAVDRISTQFSNVRGSGERIKVTLPRELIEEWVYTIEQRGFTRNTGARVIREAVAESTQYSTQLNSFETHLKAAAFALLERRTRDESSAVGYEMVAVGADWTSNEHILGYPDALRPDMYVRTQALDLLLRAHSHPESPFFLILDEMNLSHVERYFADVLSAIESGEDIHLFGETEENTASIRDGVPSSLALPDNLFVVGTVNVDETTYMFSPKVLDRANTIEFRTAPAQLASFMERPRRVDIESLRFRGKDYAALFLQLAQNQQLSPSARAIAALKVELELLLKILAENGFEFGFRTVSEITRFLAIHESLEGGEKIIQAVDAQIYQKILPRLHGSRARLEPILKSLLVVCSEHRSGSDQDESSLSSVLGRAQVASRPQTLLESLEQEIASRPNHHFPLTTSKLLRMARLVRTHGFTSFAEA